MSKLKDFLEGKKGHSHGAQEFGALSVYSSLLGWLVSPVANVVLVALVLAMHEKIKIPLVGDKYWITREVKQSKAMGRAPSGSDETSVPKIPNAFWTKDAIADVSFPRKIRPVLLAGVLAYSWFIYIRMGF